MFGEKDDLIQLFLTMAWILIYGLPLHHWNRTDISKIIIKFAHLIDIDKDTAAKSDLRAAKVKVGCDNINAIPNEIHEVIGNQLCKIIIKIENKIVHPKESVLPPHISVVDGVELGFTAGTERPI